MGTFEMIRLGQWKAVAHDIKQVKIFYLIIHMKLRLLKQTRLDWNVYISTERKLHNAYATDEHGTHRSQGLHWYKYSQTWLHFNNTREWSERRQDYNF